MKVCTNCQCELDISQFYKRADAPCGYRSHCKRCCATQNRKWSRENREEELVKGRKWRLANREKVMLSTAKNRAKKKGWEFNLTIEDIIIPKFCPVLGFCMASCAVAAQPHSPSLARVDSSKGYIKGNVKVISRRANMLKNNATSSEMYSVYKYLVETGQ